MAKLLLDHHCEVDPEDEDGETPLFNASERGDVEKCQLLVRTMRLMLLFIFKRYLHIQYMSQVPYGILTKSSEIRWGIP